MYSVHVDRVLLCRVSPFGHPRIKAHLRLPVAFRSLSRPSSALSAKAFPLRPLQLDQLLSGYLPVSRIIRVISVLLAICSTIFRSYPNNISQKNLKLIFSKIGITFIFSSIVAFAFVFVQFSRCKFFMPLAKNLLQCRISFPKFNQGANIEEFLRDASFHHRYELVGVRLLRVSLPKPLMLAIARESDLVGLRGLEPPTSRLSGVRSNHLSYKPI